VSLELPNLAIRKNFPWTWDDLPITEAKGGCYGKAYHLADPNAKIAILYQMTPFVGIIWFRSKRGGRSSSTEMLIAQGVVMRLLDPRFPSSVITLKASGADTLRCGGHLQIRDSGIRTVAELALEARLVSTRQQRSNSTLENPGRFWGTQSE